MPHTPQKGIDIHPKGPSSDVLLAAKTFQGTVKLAVHRTKDCLVTDDMLRHGAAPDRMKIANIRIWIKEVIDKRYTIICTNPPSSPPVPPPASPAHIPQDVHGPDVA